MASLLSAVYRQDDDTTMPENGGEEEVVDNHNKWEVYKFGGTSVASAERMRVAAKLTRARQVLKIIHIINQSALTFALTLLCFLWSSCYMWGLNGTPVLPVAN